LEQAIVALHPLDWCGFKSVICRPSSCPKLPKVAALHRANIGPQVIAVCLPQKYKNERSLRLWDPNSNGRPIGIPQSGVQSVENLIAGYVLGQSLSRTGYQTAFNAWLRHYEASRGDPSNQSDENCARHFVER
jgi:hypothetical protein